MKETVWIYIPSQFNDLLNKWNDYYSYDTEDSDIGKLVAYRMDTSSVEYDSLIRFLKEKNIYHYIFRRVYRFTKKEKDDAEILWLWTDDDAKDSYIPNPINCICKRCGKKSPYITRHNIHVDYKNIKKYDIMSTYHGDIETIVSEKLRQIFIQENITGVEFEPIYQIGVENKVIDGFYHLILKEGIGDVVEPSIVNKKEFCPECGFYDEFICQTTLNFKRSTWDKLDICYTKNWFGGPPKFKNLIISQKLRKILIENKVKNIYFQPAYLVD